MPLPRRAFWYLRHGETDWNARGLSQGNVDIPLNPVGVAQAEQAAGLLRGCGLRAVVSSPRFVSCVDVALIESGHVRARSALSRWNSSTLTPKRAGEPPKQTLLDRRLLPPPRTSLYFDTELPAFFDRDLEGLLVDHDVQISAVPIQQGEVSYSASVTIVWALAK